MPSTVTLQVQQPDGTSKAFALTEHDTFLLGRMEDCHLCLPNDDRVSRHHFLLEACPPQACLRDLGSMNGTHVNGKKCGGREKGETPEEGAKRQYPSVALKHGDRITVGQSSIEVRIKAAPNAPGVRQVNAALPEGDLSGVSPEAMQQLIVAAASCRRPCKGRPAPSLFENYEIELELGRGGCGAVYLAKPQQNGAEKVAVKIMLTRAQADTLTIAQFKRKMDVIAKLRHPNIERFLDSGSDEGTCSPAPIRRVDIPVRQANALRKNRAKLPTFLPSLAMVDSKVPSTRPQRHEPHRKLRSALSFSGFQRSRPPVALA